MFGRLLPGKERYTLLHVRADNPHPTQHYFWQFIACLPLQQKVQVHCECLRVISHHRENPTTHRRRTNVHVDLQVITPFIVRLRELIAQNRRGCTDCALHKPVSFRDGGDQFEARGLKSIIPSHETAQKAIKGWGGKAGGVSLEVQNKVVIKWPREEEEIEDKELRSVRLSFPVHFFRQPAVFMLCDVEHLFVSRAYKIHVRKSVQGRLRWCFLAVAEVPVMV